MNALVQFHSPVQCEKILEHSLGKNKVARNEKKSYMGFCTFHKYGKF